MSKRGQGEGNIRKRKDGIWEARYTLGRDEEGKQIRKSIYGKTRQEVAQRLTKTINELNSGIYVEPTKMVVNDWLTTWLKDYKQPSIKSKTYQGYVQLIDYYIRPSIGHIVLSELRPDHVQSMLTEIKNRIPSKAQEAILRLEERLQGVDVSPHDKKAILGEIDRLKKSKISSKTVKHIYTVLNGAIKQALKNNLIVRNVCEAVSLPKANDKKEMRVLDHQDQKKFLEAIKGHRLEAAFLLKISTGIRVGELLGLRWDDVDLEQKTISVSQTISRIKSPGTDKSKLEFGTPKTDKSKRVIPLLPQVTDILKSHKDLQENHKAKIGEGYGQYNLVFCTELGNPIDPKNLARTFDGILKRAGIDHINLHGLRHTFATRGLENGIDLKVMQELLGHSSITMTADIYSHVLPDKKRSAIEKLKDIF